MSIEQNQSSRDSDHTSNTSMTVPVRNKVGRYSVGARDNRTMAEILDEKFKNVKKSAGIQIWRIENMEMKEIKETDYGIFYSGDSYIILKTIEKRAGTERRIHFWLGEESSVDEKGGAALWATHLDDWFGGDPVQYRETQNSESEKFMGLFPNGVTYKKGGVAGAFRNVKVNENENQALYQVKGKRRPRLQEVNCEWSAFNEGDVFILEFKNWLVQWNGKSANRFEKLKACQCLAEMAARTGRAQKVIVEQGRHHQALVECLGDMPETFNPASDDSEFEKVQAQKSPRLFSVQTRKMLAEGENITQDLLKSNEAFYLLDNQKLFTWKGKDCSKDLRKKILIEVDQFLAEIGFKGQPAVESLGAGIETPPFKQLFKNWKNQNETVGIGQAYIENNVAKSIKGIDHVDIDESMRSNARKSVGESLPDDGRGDVEVYRVDTGNRENELVKIDRENYGEFFGGDCYIIVYSNKHPKCERIYFWLGSNSTIDEHTTVAHHAADLGRKSSQNPKQIRVVQGKEPAHLLKIFQNLIIYSGGTSRKGGQSKRNNPALYQARSSIYGYNRTVEIDVCAASLNSNDIFILVKDNHVWMWVGKGANSREAIAAEESIDVIIQSLSNPKVSKIYEEKETPAFWDSIGGKKEYAKIADTDAIEDAKLFVCSNASGKMSVEEIGEDFTQADLVSDDVMILDGGKTIFVWVGSGSNEDEKKHGPEIARRYAAGLSGRRTVIPIKEGAEPLEFKGFFQGWQDGYDPNAVFEKMQSDMKKMTV